MWRSITLSTSVHQQPERACFGAKKQALRSQMSARPSWLRIFSFLILLWGAWSVPKPARSKCASIPDPASCFCDLAIQSYTVPNVYVGLITHLTGPQGTESYLDVEQVYSAQGISAPYAEGDLVPLVGSVVGSVPSHSTADRYLLYFVEQLFGSEPLLFHLSNGTLTSSVPSGFLDIDERVCTESATAYDIANALTSADCWSSIRQAAGLSSGRGCVSEDGGCNGGMPGHSSALVVAFAIAFGFLRRWRPLGLA